MAAIDASCADALVAPFSAGRGRAPVDVPPDACDCHVHLYDARYPAAPGATLSPPDASAADYRRLQRRTGTQRVVFVTPSTYGIDNGPLCDALAAFGTQARGVAVVQEKVGDFALEALHARGVRGIRLNLSLGVVNSASQIEPLARRIAPLGWHLQLLAPAPTWNDVAGVLSELPVPVVFDHFGRLAPSMAGRHPSHALILRLLEKRRAWVKLSGAYIVSERGAPRYEDVAALARSFLEAAPDRVLWGSDWPHASASAGHQAMPDDARLMALLADWTGTRQALRRVLVDNPVELYGFDRSITSQETP
ncbi:putative TIM-barrel fold metal-dependent hydrolase [Variovorax boronicumulans]|uniref:TIM-barrel fold metal-dependent hydrolase n=1 Tax=Variovorax boronicumulans TaxID=436515 RepID=A0AAW8DSS9_9BURK|nr:amidohydrolase family protein [Variovorax boronicumulans]MDP9877330.1 putative TIM-barrel fold metal-dependent hydrolase [Variovorax boronicumulans]MDP9922616.1 putative TIM-barrel fold metal-dependent hydrolase [Variovorax boronicumulans]